MRGTKVDLRAYEHRRCFSFCEAWSLASDRPAPYEPIAGAPRSRPIRGSNLVSSGWVGGPANHLVHGHPNHWETLDRVSLGWHCANQLAKANRGDYPFLQLVPPNVKILGAAHRRKFLAPRILYITTETASPLECFQIPVRCLILVRFSTNSSRIRHLDLGSPHRGRLQHPF